MALLVLSFTAAVGPTVAAAEAEAESAAAAAPPLLWVSDIPGIPKKKNMVSSGIINPADGSVVAVHIPDNTTPVLGTDNRLLEISSNRRTFEVPSFNGILSGQNTPALYTYNDDGTYTRTGYGIQDRQGITANWVHEDLRRVLYVKNGDFYRATINWESGAIEASEQLTELGVFDRPQALAWSGDHVFFYVGFDVEKPVLRLNAKTGEYEEIDWFNNTGVAPALYKPGRSVGFTLSPDGTTALFASTQIVTFVDLQNGEKTVMPPPKTNENLARVTPGIGNIEGFQWLDSSRVLVQTASWGHCYLIDLAGPTAHYIDLPIDARRSPRESIRIESGVLSDQHVIFQVDYSAAGLSPKTSFFVWDLDTLDVSPLEGEAPFNTRLTRGGQSDAYWVDDRWFVFVRDDGGLSGIGTWLYDRQDGSIRRLTAKRDLGDFSLSPTGDAFLYIDGGTIHTMSFEGKSAELIKSHSFAPYQPQPFDLGWGEPLAQAWNNPPVTPVLGSRPELALDQGEDTAIFRLVKAMEGKPSDQIVTGYTMLRAISENFALSRYYDPFGMTLLAIQIREENKNTEEIPADRPGRLLQLLTQDDRVSEHLDRARIESLYQARALSIIHDRQNLTPAQIQLVTRVVGKRVADSLFARTGKLPSAGGIDHIFSNHLYSTIDEVQSGQLTAADAATADASEEAESSKDKKKKDMEDIGKGLKKLRDLFN
ncbi:MAG: hypothetical protein AAGG38_11570 [Planctomycetota bacterium]